MGKNAAYAAQYAEEAKEQMRMYGIPASVILAQAILESSNGQSQLSRECNNHFGIKATASWLKNGGEYGVYTDDRPNEKFCKYKSVGDSYEHHSQFLKQNKRYAQCFTLSPDDYKGWTKGIERAGYATGGGYAASLQRIIEANGLDKYDSEVMAEMRAEGRSFGVENNPRREMPPMYRSLPGIPFLWSERSFSSSPRLSAIARIRWMPPSSRCTRALTSRRTMRRCWPRRTAARWWR